MTNTDKYDKIFMEVFHIERSSLNEGLEYQSVESWDSVGHMGLMAEIEKEFKVELQADDIVGFSSYRVGKEILVRYGVEL